MTLISTIHNVYWYNNVMKVAIVHDQLQEFGGAERVLVALHEMFPDADIYTSFYNPESLGIHSTHINEKNVHASWADRVPFMKKLYSPLRFITPLIWESFNFSNYDLVLSSSGSYMSKGIITRPETLHLCYLHHQPRYLYYYETAREWQRYWPVRVYGHLINHKLRMWDFLSSQRVDHFIANSIETQKRITKFYRRDSTVIYPPVKIPDQIDTNTKHEKNGYYITVSRLARAKHIDTLIETANEHSLPLKIVGSGRDEDSLRHIAGETIEFMGNLSDSKRDSLIAGAKAFLFASVDDEFGIAPVEAMGHGVPVIALRSGGLKETVQEGKNGFLFDELTDESVWKSIRALESLTVTEYKKMRDHARTSSQLYSDAVFKKTMMNFINTALASHKNRHS